MITCHYEHIVIKLPGGNKSTNFLRNYNHTYKIPINIKLCPSAYRKPMKHSFVSGHFSANFYKIQAVKHKRAKTELREMQKAKKMERAEQFCSLMKENGWTKAGLARQLGVSRAWVTKVLKQY